MTFFAKHNKYHCRKIPLTQNSKNGFVAVCNESFIYSPLTIKNTKYRLTYLRPIKLNFASTKTPSTNNQTRTIRYVLYDNENILSHHTKP